MTTRARDARQRGGVRGGGPRGGDARGADRADRDGGGAGARIGESRSSSRSWPGARGSGRATSNTTDITARDGATSGATPTDRGFDAHSATATAYLAAPGAVRADRHGAGGLSDARRHMSASVQGFHALGRTLRIRGRAGWGTRRATTRPGSSVGRAAD